MGTVVGMKGEQVQNLDEARKERVLASDKCIRKNWNKESKQSMERGWEAALIERENGWEILGFKHQHAYRLALGIGYANWYRTMAIAQKFSEITKAEYLAMTLENADLLSRQEVDVRYKPENIERAGRLSIAEFKQLMAPNLTKFEDGKEQYSTFEMRMRSDKRAVIEEGIRQFQAKNGIDTPTFALELMVAECCQGPTIAGFLQKAIPNLTQSVRETGDLEELRIVILNFIQELGNLLLQGCGEERVA